MITEFNTNNAWGFGGAKGLTYTHQNGFIVSKGRNYHRHTGTSSYFDVSFSNERLKIKDVVVLYNDQDIDFSSIKEITFIEGEDNRLDAVIVGDKETVEKLVKRANKKSYHTPYDLSKSKIIQL